MKADLTILESLPDWLEDDGYDVRYTKAVQSAIAELRAARAVVEAAHKVTDGAPMEYLERRIPERNLAVALLAYDKVVGS